MQSLLNFNNVALKVPGREAPIVDDVSFSLNQQDFLVLLGGNGSGKSSLIKLINGSYKKTVGNIVFNDKPLEKIKHQVLVDEVFTLTQSVKDSLFMELTVFENGALLESRTKPASVSRTKLYAELKEFLHDFNPALSKAMDTPVNNLSGGEQQILMLALTMRHKPRILLLDEHTSALDPRTAEKVMRFTQDLISKHKVTCVMTTHNLNFALEYGNRLLAMSQGEVVYEANVEAKAALTREDLLRYCY